jgi:3-methyladenine DNA glycosylase/8-oxoguanine DNA glycosylase
MELYITTPTDFNFKRTALSHGWAQLLPFEFDQEQWKLTRVVQVDNRRAVTAGITAARGSIRVEVRDRLGSRAMASLTQQVKHMLRLDDDMSRFYSLVDTEEHFNWIVGAGAGRMLRSPTVYEDLVKTICTTNCSWSLTTKMVTALVTNLGSVTSDKRPGFPTPEAMAAQSERFYRDEIRSGYRAPYLKELAERVVSGDLDVERWLSSDLPTPELRKEMRKVKGVGDYAADNLLKLIGRYDGLALDSWLRARFALIHNKGRKTADRKIERHYARFKEWRGLALWCDMTHDWIEHDE